MHNLGELYWKQGNLDLAEDMYLRAQEGRKNLYGPGHPQTLASLNDLGNVYKDQGRYDLAEKMHEDALQGYKDTLGIEHVQTFKPALRAMTELGALYLNRDPPRLVEAEALFQRALDGYSKLQGPSSAKSIELRHQLDLIQLQNNLNVPVWFKESPISSKALKNLTP